MASYDGNGNMTGYVNDTYSYDLQNRLVQAHPSGGGTVLYGYDSTNLRVYKGAYSGSAYSAEEFYFYGVEGHKYGTWKINGSAGVVLQASVTKQWFGGRLVSPEDRLGSKGKYFAFGEERTNVSPVNPPNDQEKFATYTRDSATGLDYANQRYYSNIGRFLQPDPFGGSADSSRPQSWNRYAYVEGDPANRLDPNGLYLCAPDVDDSQLRYFRGCLPSFGILSGDSGTIYGGDGTGPFLFGSVVANVVGTIPGNSGTAPIPSTQPDVRCDIEVYTQPAGFLSDPAVHSIVGISETVNGVAVPDQYFEAGPINRGSVPPQFSDPLHVLIGQSYLDELDLSTNHSTYAYPFPRTLDWQTGYSELLCVQAANIQSNAGRFPNNTFTYYLFD